MYAEYFTNGVFDHAEEQDANGVASSKLYIVAQDEYGRVTERNILDASGNLLCTEKVEYFTDSDDPSCMVVLYPDNTGKETHYTEDGHVASEVDIAADGTRTETSYDQQGSVTGTTVTAYYAGSEQASYVREETANGTFEMYYDQSGVKTQYTYTRKNGTSYTEYYTDGEYAYAEERDDSGALEHTIYIQKMDEQNRATQL